jgi:ribosomal protein L29
MVDNADEGVEGAFKCLVSITERSGNLRKYLKKEILEAVSSLRNYFAHVQTNLESKTEANKELEKEVNECKAEIQRLRTWASSQTGQVVPSMDTVRRETDIANQVPAPVGNAGKLYSEALRAEGRREKRYKLMIISITNHYGDAIKNIIKTSMKVGICALKSLQDGTVIMETKSKEDLELLIANMYVCIYVCMYVYVCVYIYIYIITYSMDQSP